MPCNNAHSYEVQLSTCLAMFCISATFTATAFPSPSPPCYFLYMCTSHIPSLALLLHLPLPPQIPICFPDCIVPIFCSEIVRCAQKMTRRGGAGKGSGSKGCRGAEHGQACTKERTGAVAVRAALESAGQAGRGDEGNRQAEMANPTECRDSLQTELDGKTFCVSSAYLRRGTWPKRAEK
jgi:hypothetical protein